MLHFYDMGDLEPCSIFINLIVDHSFDIVNKIVICQDHHWKVYSEYNYHISIFCYATYWGCKYREKKINISLLLTKSCYGQSLASLRIFEMLLFVKSSKKWLLFCLMFFSHLVTCKNFEFQ